MIFYNRLCTFYTKKKAGSDSSNPALWYYFRTLLSRLRLPSFFHTAIREASVLIYFYSRDLEKFHS
jgi:hypothetical protein